MKINKVYIHLIYAICRYCKIIQTQKNLVEPIEVNKF